MTLLTGSANPLLGTAVAEALGTRLSACLLERFPDGELHVELRESVRGKRVFILQPTSPPVAEHLFELLLIADACRRAGARERVAVIPYFGYARQDRRAAGREPIAARVAADVLASAGIDRIVVLDLHGRSTEGFFAMPAEHASAVVPLADAIRIGLPESALVVAPDLGAAKLADRFGRLLACPTATVHKTRVSGREVKVQQISGDVRGRTPYIVDDMISTGGTVAAAVRGLLAAGCLPDVTVVATHGVFAERAASVLTELPISRIVTTDSVASPSGLALPVQIVSVAPLLAAIVARLDRDESLGDLLSLG